MDDARNRGRAVSSPSSAQRAASLTAAGSPVAPTELAARTAEFHAALVQDLEPRTTLEQVLIANISRHAAGIELGAAAEAATLKFAAENLNSANLLAPTDTAAQPYVAAVGNELLARVTKYRTQHEHGLHADLRELRELGRARRSPPTLELFSNEEACIAYLAAWQRDQPWHCPACAASERCWLRHRQRWECQCGLQFTLRTGTIFARSHAPLMAWFGVVLAQLRDPNIATAELAAQVNVIRRATVRAMAARVRDALASTMAEQLLGGLPGFVITRLRQVYFSGGTRPLVQAGLPAEANHVAKT